MQSMIHSTVVSRPVATTTTTCDRYIVHTPQRKAKYQDKNRWYLKPLKEAVLRETGCRSAAEIKKYLKALKVSLDLRLISAWKAIKFELESLIIAAKSSNKVFEPDISHSIQPVVQSINAVTNNKINSTPPVFASEAEAMNWYINKYSQPRISIKASA